MSLDSSAEPNTGGRRFTSVRQLELLVEFMEAHKDLALGRVQSKEARALASRLWNECATICNAEGTFRNPKEWSRYWNDVKGRVKAKLRSISRSMSGTGGGPSIETAMSPIEDRVAAILGRDVVTPLQGVQQNPFQTQNFASSEAPEASQEDHHVEENENIDMNVVEFYDVVDVVQPDSDGSEAPLTSAQPSQSQVNQPGQSIPHSARRTRARAPSRNLQSQQAESAMEESRATFVRLEELKIKVEEKRIEVEKSKVEALKEIALAINRLGDKLSSSAHGHGHPKKKRRVISSLSSDSDD